MLRGVRRHEQGHGAIRTCNGECLPQILLGEHEVFGLRVLHAHEEQGQVAAAHVPGRRAVCCHGLVVLAVHGEGVPEAEPRRPKVHINARGLSTMREMDSGAAVHTLKVPSGGIVVLGQQTVAANAVPRDLRGVIRCGDRPMNAQLSRRASRPACGTDRRARSRRASPQDRRCAVADTPINKGRDRGF